MSDPFHLNLNLPRAIGDGTNLEIIMVPLEVRVCWDDDDLHVISARVTDFVRLDTGHLVYRAGEAHTVGSPDDIKQLKAECARLDAEREETEREDFTAMGNPWQHNSVAIPDEFQRHRVDDFDQRRAA